MNKEAVLLGIDLGTSSVKVVACAADGTILGTATREYPILSLSATMVEHDARLWLQGTCEAVRQCLQVVGSRGEELQAIGVSSQGFSFVPLDAQGRELRNAIVWLDTRAEKELAQVETLLGKDEIIRRTGRRALAACLLPLLLWLRAHEPQVWRQSVLFLMAMDYLIFKMTGVACTDPTLASGSLLMDLADCVWMEDIFAQFHLPPASFPRIFPAGVPVERLSASAAAELGISGRPVVVTGGQDQKCAALAAGISSERGTISLGTAAAVTAFQEKPRVGARLSFLAFLSLPGSMDPEGVVGTAAAAMEWARALLGETDFSLLEAPATPETSKELFFFPYLAGATSPYWQGEARGVVRGLSLATSRQDFLAAVVRGICYELRANLEAIEAIMAADSSTVAETTLNGATAKRPPVILKEIAVFGGGSKSRYWLQTLTAVLGRPLVHILHPDLRGSGPASWPGGGSVFFRNWPCRKTRFAWRRNTCCQPRRRLSGRRVFTRNINLTVRHIFLNL